MAEGNEEEMVSISRQELAALKKSLADIEEELVLTKAELVQEHIQKYLEGNGLKSLPESVIFKSLKEAEDFVKWLSDQQTAAALKPFDNPVPHRLSEEDVRKKESERFLKNLFPWLN